MAPCHWSALNGHLEITRLLINYGASRHKRDKVCYYDTLAIKLHLSNVGVKECLYNCYLYNVKLLSGEYIWYMYMCTCSGEHHKSTTVYMCIFIHVNVICSMQCYTVDCSNFSLFMLFQLWRAFSWLCKDESKI